MKIQFCGAAKTVTGSCYYVDTGKVKFVVDCGAFQGPDDMEKHNRDPFPFNPSELDFVLLTHAHFDHCGRLPMLVKQGFKGRIISTQPTRDLTQIVLLDSAGLQKEEYSRWKSRLKRQNRDKNQDPNYNSAEEGWQLEQKEPLYNEDDVWKMLQYFEVNPYGSSITLNDNLEIRMRDAGHIIGSVIFEVWVKNEVGRTRKIVFSGDLGQPGQRIIKDPDYIRDADYVVVESTYGNRIHKSKDETILEFLSVLKEAGEKGGNVLIPVFAIERSQEVIYELNLFFENDLVKKMPAFLDSPMAIEAMDIFKRYPTFYDEDARRLLEKGDDPFDFPGLNLVSSVDESKRLISQKNAVIMAGSGMCTGGRIVHHLANNIDNPNNHIIFVGYQVKGTLGREILDKAAVVNIKGKQYDVKMQVHTLGGFSAHADERDLRYWLRSFGHSPKKIFVTHGDEDIAPAFARNVNEELQVETYVPFLYEEVTLD